MSENNIPVKLKKLKLIHEACKSMRGYLPLQDMIRIDNLEDKLNTIKSLDNEINAAIEQLKPKQKERSTMVNSKEEGVSKIIAEVRKYVRGNYGVNSEEWNSIKNIKA